MEKAYAAAKNRGADDAIMLRSGILYETTRGNLFWIKSGVVHTPELNLGCLPGVMRAWVIRQLRRRKIPVREGRYDRSALLCADAVFRTNALIGVSWVREIIGFKKWRGPLHPIAARLQRDLRARILRLKSSRSPRISRRSSVSGSIP